MSGKAPVISGMKSHSLRRKLTLAFACFAVVAFAVWQCRAKRHVTRVPLTILKGTGFLTFKASVNGREIRMAVDTAANTTVFNLGLVEELQLESKGETGISFRAEGGLPLHTAHIEDFRVGDVSYHGDFPFVDLSRPQEGIEMVGDPPIEGLLGADLLITWDAVIDYEELTLVIRHR